MNDIQLIGYHKIRQLENEVEEVNEQTEDITTLSNLLNDVLITNGEYINIGTGVITVGATFSRTDYIPVDPTKTYILISGFMDGSTGCFLTTSKTFISSIVSNGRLAIPVNASFMVLNLLNSHDSIVSCSARYVNIGNMFVKNFSEYPIFSDYYGKLVAFMGDSITYGTGITYPYHALVKDQLGLGRVNNYGVNGCSISASNGVSPSEAIATRYSQIKKEHDVVVIAGGTNDYSGSTPMGTLADTTDISFYGAMRVLCEGLINRFLGKKIIFVTPLHRATETVNSVGKTLTDYRNAIIEVCLLYGIPTIDGFTLGFNSLTNFKTTYMTDGLHPTQDGHIILGKAIANRMASI